MPSGSGRAYHRASAHPRVPHVPWLGLGVGAYSALAGRSMRTGTNPRRRMAVAFLVAGTSVAGVIAIAVLHPASSAAACGGGGGTSTPGGRSSALFGVDATSKTDAWAVGYANSQGADRTLAMHWNGSRWTRVPTPNPGSSCDTDRLFAVEIVSPSDAWAVGSSLGGSGERAVVLHWDGT